MEWREKGHIQGDNAECSNAFGWKMVFHQDLPYSKGTTEKHISGILQRTLRHTQKEHFLPLQKSQTIQCRRGTVYAVIQQQTLHIAKCSWEPALHKTKEKGQIHPKETTALRETGECKICLHKFSRQYKLWDTGKNHRMDATTHRGEKEEMRNCHEFTQHLLAIWRQHWLINLFFDLIK